MRGAVVPLAIAGVLAGSVGSAAPAAEDATVPAEAPAAPGASPDAPAVSTAAADAPATTAPPDALAAEPFVCPEGTKDSGAREKQVVRWCGYEREGRVVFHGPVWRFHRNGRVQAKDRFVDGELDGERSTYWDNGRLASQGAVQKGERVGVWRYWDEEGHLAYEEGFSESGLERADYYPSGKRRASGLLRDGAKVGFWELAYEDGGKSRCDFGDGLFALPDDEDCRKIAEEVEPKGFARPVAKAAVGEDGLATVTIGPQAYAFRAPEGWVADAAAGAAQGVPLVFFPEGSAWKDPHRNMWIKVILKEGRQLDVVTFDERMAFAKRVGDYREFFLPPRQGRLGRIEAETLRYTIPTRPDAPFAMVEERDVLGAVAFIDVSPEIVLAAVLEADFKVPMKRSRDPFIELVKSARPGRTPPPAPARAGR